MADNGAIVIMSDRLQMAVNNALSIGYQQLPSGANRPNRRNSLNQEIPSMGNNNYNGYFTLYLVKVIDEATGTSKYKVRIVDGATYDPEAGSSGNSVCRVNNVIFSVPYYETDFLSGPGLFYLMYSAAVAASGDVPAQPAKVEIVRGNIDSDLPSDSAKNSYYQLGRITRDSWWAGYTHVTQDHITGIPQLWWYMACTEL